MGGSRCVARCTQHQLFEYTPATARSSVTWPGAARLALWVVPNVEHYELMDPKCRIDVPQFPRTDYGNRVGIWRLMNVPDSFGIPGAVALNSAVCRYYPAIVDPCLQRDWELMGNGITNSQTLSDLQPEEQRELIGTALEEIRRASGKRVRGWLGPRLHESPATLDLLKGAGVAYTCDCIALHPFIIGTPGRIGLLEDILGISQITRRMSGWPPAAKSWMPVLVRLARVVLHEAPRRRPIEGHVPFAV